LRDEALSIAKKHLAESRDVVSVAIATDRFVNTIVAISDLVTACLRAGNKVLFAGNGGSAADAQHMAGEFVARLNYDRDPIAGMAITTDSFVLTSICNDYAYEPVVSRQVRGLGRAGDILVAISTSGRSPNILAAVAAARDIGIHTVGFTGSVKNELAELCEIVLHAPSTKTPLIQQIHIMAAHAVCELVELDLFPKNRTSLKD